MFLCFIQHFCLASSIHRHTVCYGCKTLAANIAVLVYKTTTQFCIDGVDVIHTFYYSVIYPKLIKNKINYLMLRITLISGT